MPKRWSPLAHYPVRSGAARKILTGENDVTFNDVILFMKIKICFHFMASFFLNA